MALSDVSLTSGMRSNLGQLQDVVTLMNRTQERLSSGKRVNTALDNPTNYFTAQNHSNRANDISSKKDGMAEAIQTIKAADAGVKQITALIATAKGLATSAKSASIGTSYTNQSLTISGITAGTTVTVGGSVFTAVLGAASATQFSIGATSANDNVAAANLAAAVNAGNEGTAITAVAVNSNKITFQRDTPGNMTGSDVQFTSSSFSKADVAGSTDRANYAAQFNTLMTEIASLANVSGYKGVNLLGSSTLKVSFEKTTLNVAGFDGTAGLAGYTAANAWAADVDIDAAVTKLESATTTLRQQSSVLASNLSVITVNQDFSNDMIRVLNTGADNLTLADMNEEGANMLMLQTRNSLGTQALSMSAQNAQSVMRLFS